MKRALVVLLLLIANALLGFREEKPVEKAPAEAAAAAISIERSAPPGKLVARANL